MRKFITLLIGLGLTINAYSIETNLIANTDKILMNKWVDSVLHSMNTDERIGQLFMIVGTPTNDSKNIQTLENIISQYKVGGVLFHKGDPIQQAEVTNKLQNKTKIPLFIALDGEWGLSMRLTNTTRFPKNMMLGAIDDLKLIALYAQEVGRQCKELGIHINFAPVIDVNSNVNNPIIGLRSFGENPEIVADQGIAYAYGLESMGVMAVAKHFPGHGDTSEDSHHTLPSVLRSREALDSVELLPFKRFINAGFSGIMPTHLFVPALDQTKNRATSMSKAVVNDLLKKELGFQGLCISDALVMKGATAGSNENPAVQALVAGNDIVMEPTSLTNAINAVKTAIKNGTLKESDISNTCKKILQYKYAVGLHQYKPITINGLHERLNSKHADWLNTKLHAESMTALKNSGNILPLRQLHIRKIAVLAIGESQGDDFKQMMENYAVLPYFKITPQTNNDELGKIFRDLNNFDIVICSVHSSKLLASQQQLLNLVQKKAVAFVFFISPYQCVPYRQLIEQSKAVIMAYENTPTSQQCAAQVVFGGLPAHGKLAVTIPSLFPAGTGVKIPKTRLGYHQPEEVGFTPALADSIDKIVGEGLRENAYPGCQVLVAKNGLIVYQKAYGVFDKISQKKVTNEAVYDLASVSKAAGTLLAVMKTYDENKLNLDTPVSLYVPELQGTNKDNIRIEELLYHQSGLPSHLRFYTHAIDNNSFMGKLFSNKQSKTHPIQYESKLFARDKFRFDPNLVSTTKKSHFSTQVAKDIFLHDTFRNIIMNDIRESKLSKRGKYVYSDLNFILLKNVVEQLNKQPMDVFLKNTFFDRLGATSVTYNPLKIMDVAQIVPTENDRFLKRNLIRGYVHDEAAAFQGGVAGNAGLFANANDLAKILQLYLNNGQYGGESYVSETTCQLFTQSKSRVSRRGLGFDKPDPEKPDETSCGTLAPTTTYGHSGYTGTCFWIDPDNQLIFVFLSNRVNPNRLNSKLGTLNIRPRLHDAIYQQIKK